MPPPLAFQRCSNYGPIKPQLFVKLYTWTVKAGSAIYQHHVSATSGKEPRERLVLSGEHVLQSHILGSACGVSDMFKVHESRSHEGDCALNSLEDNCFSQSFKLQPPVSKFRDEVNSQPPFGEGREIEVLLLWVHCQLVCVTEMKGSVFYFQRSVNENTDASAVEI